MQVTQAGIIEIAQKWSGRLGHDYIVYMTPTGWQYCRRDLFFNYKNNDLAKQHSVILVTPRGVEVLNGTV
jgi:hypothetical protein